MKKIQTTISVETMRGYSIVDADAKFFAFACYKSEIESMYECSYARFRGCTDKGKFQKEIEAKRTTGLVPIRRNAVCRIPWMAKSRGTITLTQKVEQLRQYPTCAPQKLTVFIIPIEPGSTDAIKRLRTDSELTFRKQK